MFKKESINVGGVNSLFIKGSKDTSSPGRVIVQDTKQDGTELQQTVARQEH